MRTRDGAFWRDAEALWLTPGVASPACESAISDGQSSEGWWLRWRSPQSWPGRTCSSTPVRRLRPNFMRRSSWSRHLPGTTHAFGVAHNAGNNLGTLARARNYGADVLEIDVISARGQLVAGRDQPWGWLARQLFRGPTLVQAWDSATAAEMVKLDLMQADRPRAISPSFGPCHGSRSLPL
jgi:hypothetical protein